ncbi:MAG: hypothetical protein J6M95_04570 [Bacilli bacterium]|nr:hypothetical protein [Bacilli bacterium]
MKQIFEPAFEIVYLAVGLFFSIYIFLKAKRRIYYILFAMMGFTLVLGDACHLIPRMLNSWEIPVSDIYAMLGIGKLITSITMTIFYVMLFWFYKLKYNKTTPLALDISIYFLAVTRIVICLLPQNEWTKQNSPYLWGIYRNIPFFILGVLMVLLSYRWTKQKNDEYFRFAWIAISLSFVFYALTVAVTAYIPAFGMFMIPKTLCYIWLLIMGFRSVRKKE